MRRLVLDVATPLDLQMRLTILESLASRPGADEESRALISAARKEEAGEVIIAASIKLAQDNRETNQVSAEYLTETQRELDAIGPKMDARRQAALGTLAAVKRLDLLPVPNPLSGLHGIGLHKHRETLRFSAAEWETLAEALGGDEAVLVALGIERKNFLEVFGNDLNASGAIAGFALQVLDSASAGATAAAIRFAEHCRPRSGFLRELCLQSLKYQGTSNWDSFSTSLTAGEVIGRNFSGDTGLENQLVATVNANIHDSGAIMALCEGWPTSKGFFALRSRFDPQQQRVPIVLRLTTVLSAPDHFVDTLGWASDNLEGGLWDSLPHWVPAAILRLKTDEEAYRQMRDILFADPSPGVKASFPRLLARARTLEDDLRDWCRAECAKEQTRSVAEVGMDLIAGQPRLVSQSLFDLLSGRDV